jgi:hypothetical protein
MNMRWKWLTFHTMPLCQYFYLALDLDPDPEILVPAAGPMAMAITIQLDLRFFLAVAAMVQKRLYVEIHRGLLRLTRSPKPRLFDRPASRLPSLPLWLAAMANFMACGVAAPNSLGEASSKHHRQRRMRLVWSKSVGGTNSYDRSVKIKK